MNNFYVYIYKEPLSNTPFYVGKGVGDRYLAHLKKSHNKWINLIISDLKRRNQTPIIDIHFCDDEQMAYELEMILIKKYGRLDIGTGTLCNHTSGGDGPIHQSKQDALISRVQYLPGNKKRKFQRKSRYLQWKNGWNEERRQKWEQKMLLKHVKRRMRLPK